jgi:hypothetical protein
VLRFYKSFGVKGLISYSVLLRLICGDRFGVTWGHRLCSGVYFTSTAQIIIYSWISLMYKVYIMDIMCNVLQFNS